MKHPLLTLTLAGTLLALAAVGDAAPRQKRQTPATTLTQTEQVCQAIGTFAYHRALDRDAGVAMLRALDLSRQWDRTHAVPALYVELHETIIRALYAHPAVSAAFARQQTELACVQELAPPQPPSPAKQRY